MTTSGTASDNEWQRVYNERQQMTKSGTTSDNEWQLLTTSGTTNEREWQRVIQQLTTRDNKWQWVRDSDSSGTTNEKAQYTSKNGWLPSFQ